MGNYEKKELEKTKNLLQGYRSLINETHQQLNGQLRQELKLLETENIKDKNLLQGYKKVIEELTDKLNKKS